MLYWRVGYRRQSEGQNKQSYQCYTGVLDIGEDSLRAKTELSMLYWRVGYRRRQSEGQNRVIYVILACWI